jgi:hypothetical protein
MALGKSTVSSGASEDCALCGDTRHPLSYMPLPKQEPPYLAHKNPMPNGRDPNMLRYDQGHGTGEHGEFSDY